MEIVLNRAGNARVAVVIWIYNKYRSLLPPVTWSVTLSSLLLSSVLIFSDWFVSFVLAFLLKICFTKIAPHSKQASVSLRLGERSLHNVPALKIAGVFAVRFSTADYYFSEPSWTKMAGNCSVTGSCFHIITLRLLCRAVPDCSPSCMWKALCLKPLSLPSYLSLLVQQRPQTQGLGDEGWGINAQLRINN